MKYLIAGLGNIRREYANTRHNIGFVIADALAAEGKGMFKTERLADVCKLKYRGKMLVMIKPSTYMNNSGRAVKYWLDQEKIPIENTLVIVDDVALPHGVLRMRAKGGDGGHNGMISIIEHLKTQKFPRLRVGIGHDFAQGYQVEYVLGKWTKSEEKLMTPGVEKAVEMVKSFVANGIDNTMNMYNK